MAHYPSLFQINTRVFLSDLGRRLGRRATLDDIPDDELDRLGDLGFDWIWLLSLWQTGPAGRRVSRSRPEWQAEFHETLPDLQEDDIGGSGFAIADYTVDRALGGDAALVRLRKRMRRRGLRLMLDFVPNHTALDHPWVENHPEYFVAGTEADLEREPQNYTRVRGAQNARAERILAYGRDPHFSGWPDTLQLDYSNPATQWAMRDELKRIADRCDGVRCDMAMLVLPEIFEQTWGRRPEPFWPRVIPQVRDKVPGFCFMAEVYWDREWTLQQEGFDYAYDKRLYDRLRAGRAQPVREHLHAGLEYQNKLVRFLENHDEARAAAAFGREEHEAAALISFLSPGLRFFHQGQLEGRRKRVSPHLVRAPPEPKDEAVQRFYDRLLSVLRSETLRAGEWQLLECAPAWDGNGTHEGFLAFAWEGGNGAEGADSAERADAAGGGDATRLIVTVNYAPHQGQCYVRVPFQDLTGRAIRLDDPIRGAHYDRAGSEVVSRGLFVDLGPWGYHVFSVRADGARSSVSSA